MPFVTEEIWQHLRDAAGGRGMPWDAGDLPETIMLSAWPEPPEAWSDPRTEEQFGTFLGVVGAIREIRARQNVPPKTRVPATIRADRATADLLGPMLPAIQAMAGVDLRAVGPDAAGAAGDSTASVRGCDLFVDLADLVDVDAEIARLEKEVAKTAGFIEAKQRKLADEKFAARAPEAVVAKERAQLAELEDRLAKDTAAAENLRARKAASG